MDGKAVLHRTPSCTAARAQRVDACVERGSLTELRSRSTGGAGWGHCCAKSADAMVSDVLRNPCVTQRKKCTLRVADKV